MHCLSPQLLTSKHCMVDLISVNNGCRTGEEHSGGSRQASERVGCKASLQLEEDYLSPSSLGASC